MIDEDKLKSDIKKLLTEAIGQEIIPDRTEESIKDVLLPAGDMDLKKLLVRSIIPKDDLYFIVDSLVHADVMGDLVIGEKLRGYFTGQIAVNGEGRSSLSAVTIKQQTQQPTGVSIYAGGQPPGVAQGQSIKTEPEHTETEEEGKYRRRKFLRK